jgi:peptidyl-prolyl cis-trans isomerase C
MLMRARKTSFTALAVAAMAILAVPTLAHAKAEDSGVAAVVNGDKILKSEVEGVMKQNNVKAEDQQKVYPVVVDKIIDQKLVDEAAAKSNVQKSPEFQQRLAQAKEQIVQQIYIENYLKDKVNDKAIKAEYEKIKKDNKGKEEVHVRHILVKTEAEAKQVVKDLDSGAKFEDLAKERSADSASAKNGGDIGYFAKGEVFPEISDAAFNLKPHTYTETPVKSQLGWHVLYLEDKRERVVPELKEVEDRIRTNLAQEAVKQLLQNLTAKADIKRFDMNGKPITGEVQKD